MMMAVSGWLKTVITVIMLATFVDLLLPTSTMQRYVRTVMSLFVLLTLLSPVVQLFQRDWQPDKLFNLIEGEQARMTAAEQAGGTIPSLEVIQRKAEQLKAVNTEREKRFVESQLGAQIHERLQSETELAIAAVIVSTAMDKSNKPYIKDVEVTLGPPKPSASAGNSSNTDSFAGTADPQPAPSGTSISTIGKPLAIEIKPVDPVRISTGGTDHHTSAAAAGDGSLPAPYRQDQTVIARILVKDYQLAPDRIHVHYSGAAKAF